MPSVRLNPMSTRVLGLSWCAALVAWPLAWLLLAAAQGLGTVVAGGGWVGIAIPLGAHPWSLVNEPVAAFASTRAALFGYWLAPPLVAITVAALLPTMLPVPPGWLSEVGIFQTAVASCVLGLGLAPALGVVDGPAAGLAQAWGVAPAATVTVSVLAGAALIPLAVGRLTSHLWSEPGGAVRGRRILVVAAHALPPAACWILASLVQGWAMPPRAFLAVGGVLAGAFLAAWRRMPSSPLHPRPDLRWGRVAAVGVVGAIVAAAALWAGAPRRGHGTAFVWGIPGANSNVRTSMDVVRVTRPRAPSKPPAR
jgi:hypothetical protein